jgi:site-specific recombinase XerD
MSTKPPTSLACALRGFFSDYLPVVRGVSPHTVLSYRDAFVLLLRFLAPRHRRGVIDLDLPDLTTSAVVAFLEHLETERRNRAVTRNARLAAIHAFARYVAQNHPEHIQLCQQILALPFKRARQRTVEYLEAEEIRALLDEPKHSSPDGRRDRCLLLTFFNTGARVQEILDMRPCDLQLVRPFQVRLRGKGRKERVCPLWPQTVEALRALLDEHGVEPNATQPLFRNRRGEPLTRFGVRYLLRKHARAAQAAVPTLGRRRVHPHALRHTSAVHLLQAGVDLVTISHWLGHASVETTNRYAAINLETKRAALARAKPTGHVNPVVAEWRNDATILAWLEAL